MNISKERYEKLSQNEEERDALFLKRTMIIAGFIGFLVGYTNSLWFAAIGLFIGVITGAFVGGNLISFLPSRWELKVPHGIFSYFDEKNEKVLKAYSIGKLKQYGSVGYFDEYVGSNFYRVETENAIYVTELDGEKVIYCSVQKK